MPLHKIPLCNIKYIGDYPLGSATFDYDVRHKMNRSNTKSCESIMTHVEKSDTFLVQQKDYLHITRENPPYLYSYNKVDRINKENSKNLYNNHIIDLVKNELLEISNTGLGREILKETSINLNYYKEFKLTLNHNLDIETTLVTEISKSKVFDLNYHREFKLIFNHNLEVETTPAIEISKSKVFGTLDRINIRSLNITKDSFILSRYYNLNLCKSNEIHLDISRYHNIMISRRNICMNKGGVEDLNKNYSVNFLSDNVLFNIGKIDNDKLLDRRYNKEIRFSSTILYLSTMVIYPLNYTNGYKSLIANNLLTISNDNITKLMYHTKIKPIAKDMSGKVIYNAKVHRLYIKANLSGLNIVKAFNINKVKEVMIDKDTICPIIKSISDKAIYNANIHKIDKHIDNIELLNDTIKNIIYSHNYKSLQKPKDINVFINNVKEVFPDIPIQINNNVGNLELNKIVKNKPIMIEEEKQILKIKELNILDKIQNNKNLDYNRSHGLDKDSGAKSVNYKYPNLIDINKNDIYLDKLSKLVNKVTKGKYLEMPFKLINKVINDNYLEMSFKLIDRFKYRLMYKSNLKGIIKGRYRLMYKSWKSLGKINFIKGLNKNIISILDIPEIKGLNKEYLPTFKDYLRSMDKDKIPIQSINATKSICKERMPVFIFKERSMYRERMQILYELHPHLLEVTKRWWVLGATGPYDNKILPYDYDYKNKPLWVNRRDRKWGGHYTELKNHPISYMPYFEENKGGDLHYGTQEMAISVEIMLDMANLLVMVFKHSSSQLANCSGQEAIEFIMEIFFDWLNLDSTIEEMNIKGSREHYLRCYRWFRWEAEKVWFMADKDHTIYCVQGIKYAGMLIQNILEYMKNHHFNLVPLWRNITYMDIERQFNREATNNDIIKELDKLKCQRHYYIETKYLGGRK